MPPKIALVQYDADRHFNDYETNLKNLTTFANEAVANNAKIIVFPEGSLYGYASTDRRSKWCLSASAGCVAVSGVAEAIPEGRSTRVWAEFAKAHGVFLLFNIPEAVAVGRAQATYRNTTVIVGPDGYVGKYSKRALYITNKAYAQAGTTDYVLSTPFGKFGLLICMDATAPGHLEAYSGKVDGVILMMDWDDAPDSAAGAKGFFERRSAQSGLKIFASDMSSWDGTGIYTPDQHREREGLPSIAVGLDGISYGTL